MAKVGTALVGLCAAAALAGCGGSDGARTDSLDGADWTLTILSPSHGEMVSSPAVVDVAITGRMAAQGVAPDFQLGFFLGDELLETSADTSVELGLPMGDHVLRVQGVDDDGLIIEEVLGDEIDLRVGSQFEPNLQFENPTNGNDGSHLDLHNRFGIIPGPGLDEDLDEVIEVEEGPALQ